MRVAFGLKYYDTRPLRPLGAWHTIPLAVARLESMDQLYVQASRIVCFVLGPSALRSNVNNALAKSGFRVSVFHFTW